MKTKNNVQKAVLRSMAVIISFVLISFTVNAQEFWKMLLSNSSFNEIAIAMVDTPEDTNAPEPSAFSAEFMSIESDNELVLENWMTNENNFTNSCFLLENEPKTTLENWMFNEDLFTYENEERPLVIEDWMMDESNWLM